MGDVLGEYIAICATLTHAAVLGNADRRVVPPPKSLFPPLRWRFGFGFACEEDMLIFLATSIEISECCSGVRNAASGRIVVAIDTLACRASLRAGD